MNKKGDCSEWLLGHGRELKRQKNIKKVDKYEEKDLFAQKLKILILNKKTCIFVVKLRKWVHMKL